MVSTRGSSNSSGATWDMRIVTTVSEPGYVSPLRGCTVMMPRSTTIACFSSSRESSLASAQWGTWRSASFGYLMDHLAGSKPVLRMRRRSSKSASPSRPGGKLRRTVRKSDAAGASCTSGGAPVSETSCFSASLSRVRSSRFTSARASCSQSSSCGEPANLTSTTCRVGYSARARTKDSCTGGPSDERVPPYPAAASPGASVHMTAYSTSPRV
mmetsp:Transcript_819/g.2212  ORF Transcript_819/g.2212 Transcript_819/m.2212 type:complete len:213 (+) Transcript_819:1921-2559(+)|eukprot:scaffold222953_cov32-Tisochrysis_lutea.AAC.1